MNILMTERGMNRDEASHEALLIMERGAAHVRPDHDTRGHEGEDA
jgi:hypothetical protein